jgi:sterol 3beta-glucosyltransferase
LYKDGLALSCRRNNAAGSPRNDIPRRYFLGAELNVTIATFGSRGDTQPNLALALGLRQAGHNVTLVAPRDLEGWIRSYGVSAHPMQFSAQEFMRKPEVVALFKSRNMVRQLRTIRQVLDTLVGGVLDDTMEAAMGADFLVLPITECGGTDIAARRGIPMAYASLQPMYPPTGAFPSFFLPLWMSFGGRMNRLTYTLFMRISWPFLGGSFNRWRAARFNLPPWRTMREMLSCRRGYGTPWLFAFSPLVVPKPPDWEDIHHVTGYWFLDAAPGWRPPDELVHFLDNGPKPVYIGFGSMSDKNPERQARTALRALEASGQRGIISTGWGGIARLETTADVLFVDDIPHSWLFPRTAAVVHHGGAGTAAAGFRAGVPSLIAPFAADQYAWAVRAVNLGVGPRMPDAKGLTPDKLARAICAAVNDPAIRARAAAVGENIRAEDGVARAVETIEHHAEEFGRKFGP